MDNRIRKNVYLNPDIADYLEKQATAFGMSQSAYVNMILYQCKQQAQALSDISKIDSLMKKLETMVNNHSS